jgi:hypothetical protein
MAVPQQLLQQLLALDETVRLEIPHLLESADARGGRADERSKVEAAGIHRDANKTERSLHIQELGVPGDPIVSVVIWCPRAERGQSATAIIRVPLLPWRYRRRRDRGILPSWRRPLPPRSSPKRLP